MVRMVMRSRLKGARVCRCRGDQSGQQEQQDKDATDGLRLLLFHSKSVVGYGKRSVPTVRVRSFSIYLVLVAVPRQKKGNTEQAGGCTRAGAKL